MATSLIFSPTIKDVLPIEVLEKLRILPITIHDEKLCLIARRPLSSEALMELKNLTGFEDYELQIVGEDVIEEYLLRFKTGTAFDLN
ncbi:MAG TPA: hypothetical protein VM901_02640 [Bdellovibrionota bacterium]|jgi:hypothetical protein|nr:hypothetical protein [Bdellovibrionota bacterium]